MYTSSIFFLVLLLCCTSLVFSSRYDENTLLEIKQQLGYPYGLGWWVKGFDYCNESANVAPEYSQITCTSTGRVESLVLHDLNGRAVARYPPFPDGICGLTYLVALDVYEINVFGSIPSCITKLSHLVRLGITKTYLSGPVPGFSGQTKPTNLTNIDLSGNQLSGTIPPSLFTLPKLDTLNLASNNLTGTIPPGILHTKNPALLLTNNSLSGELPKSYGSVEFSRIDVGGNQLGGDASFLFGKQKAQYIVLANNNFEFDLSYIEFSDNIYGVDLSHNKIYGKVPDSFATAQNLWYPNLSFNRLCGELPKGGNMWRFGPAVFANNSCLCGPPLPPCSNWAPAPAPES
ncbi:Polygalacturonase inhibitor protein [Rhynchospora pubera]|uniref:Polygalacturonase inhibitor protein n=1 Tax=Rhynchospora pubera TaxID=906938 RepID=A0AAV8HRQ8_9POAL|nr:Polygalacturonase inhibitor protein [Rhynchospora pubera]